MPTLADLLGDENVQEDPRNHPIERLKRTMREARGEVDDLMMDGRLEEAQQLAEMCDQPILEEDSN